MSTIIIKQEKINKSGKKLQQLEKKNKGDVGQPTISGQRMILIQTLEKEKKSKGPKSPILNYYIPPSLFSSNS